MILTLKKESDWKFFIESPLGHILWNIYIWGLMSLKNLIVNFIT